MARLRVVDGGGGRPPDVEGGCQYFEWEVSGGRQWVAL